jgi:hypothetical protein
VLLAKVQVDPERLELGNERIIAQNCTAVSVETKLRALGARPASSGRTVQHLLPKGLGGDLPAANLRIRICEQRTMVLGLNSRPG